MSHATRNWSLAAALAASAVLAVWFAVDREPSAAPGDRAERAPEARAGPSATNEPGTLVGLPAPKAAQVTPPGATPRPKRPLEGTLRRGPGPFPAAGVRVWAVPLQGQASPAPAWVETDAQGRFRFEELLDGTYRLIARLGPLADEIEAAASVEPGSTPFDAELPRPSRVAPPRPTDSGGRGRIRIVGHDGGAVARARVAMLPGTAFGGYVDVLDGEFMRFPGETWNTSYEITAPEDAGGRPLPYGPLELRFEDAGEQMATVQLPRERVVTGRVLGADGAGVAGVRIQAMRDAKGPPLPSATATTGRDGAFRLGNLGAGAYRLEGDVAPPLRPSGEWRLPPGVERIDLQVAAGIGVTVQVTDDSGQAIAGADVSVSDSGRPTGKHPPMYLTDASGQVRLEGLDPLGPSILRVSPPLQRSDLRALRIDTWKPQDATFVLERGYVVRGTLRDARGEPARGFVNRKLPDGTFVPAAGTMPNGTFELRGLPPGPITLAGSAGPGRRAGPAVAVEAGATEVTLELPPEPAR